MIPTQDRDFLRLLERSKDHGDGWRRVSKTCWTLVEAFKTTELLEMDKENMRVRLTPAGIIVVKFVL